MNNRTEQGRQSWGLGVATPRFWARGLWGVAGWVVYGSWNIIIYYHLQEVWS